MSKNKEVDNFLDGLNEDTSEKDPFASEIHETSEEKEEVGDESEESSDEKDEEESKPEPFHKDPKVQRYVDKQIAKALSNFKPEVDATEVQKFIKESGAEDEDDLVSAFTGLIGNDTPEKLRVLKAVRKAFNDAEEKGAHRAMEEFESRQQMAVREEVEAQEELSQGFEDIEEEFGIDITSNSSSARRIRNDFIDFVQKIAPKDLSGNVTDYPDFTEAYTVFQETRKSETKSATTNRAKELSSRSMGRSSGDTPAPVSGDKSWNAVDKLFNKFKN